MQQQRAAGGKATARDTAAGAPDILVALPAVVFAWFGRLMQVGGVLFLALTVLVALATLSVTGRGTRKTGAAGSDEN